ncbi:MAG TPA: PH domain-containing protein [Thermoanaerobaculia bacterium]|nr:PH domain-containing protein [Thermoanaerobaculia bacterium]
MAIEDQLQTGEEILYRAYPTRLPLVPWVGGVALSLVAAGLAWNLWGNPPLTLAAGVVALVFLGAVLIKLVVIRSHDYVLTNRRVVLEEGIFSRRSTDASLGKINNVEHRQTLWGRLLGYGEVEIDTASETGATRFNGISRPLEFKRAILGAVEGYRYTGSASPPTALSPAEKIRQLKGLLDEGLISPQEFEAKRQELLAEM